MSWLAFVLVCVAFTAVTRLAQRALLGKDKVDPIAFSILFQTFTGLFVLLFALINGFSFPDFEKYWPAIISTVVLFGLGNIALAKSLQTVEASVFSVLFATSVIWIMLCGVLFFGESLSLLHLTGALLTFVSVIFLVEKKGKFQFDRGVLLGLLSALLIGLAIIGWVYVGRRSEPISWNAITFLAPAAINALLFPQALSKTKNLLSGPNFLKLLLASSTFAVSTITLLYAYKYGEITQVAPLQQTTIIVTVLLAVIFLKETKNLTHKIISAFICFVGVLMIVS